MYWSGVCPFECMSVRLLHLSLTLIAARIWRITHSDSSGDSTQLGQCTFGHFCLMVNTLFIVEHIAYIAFLLL